MSASNKIAGFRTTGVYPINRSVIPVKSKESATAVVEQSKLKFLPLCNPSPRALEISKRIPTFTQAQLEKYEKDLKLKMLIQMKITNNGLIHIILITL